MDLAILDEVDVAVVVERTPDVRERKFVEMRGE